MKKEALWVHADRTAVWVTGRLMCRWGEAAENGAKAGVVRVGAAGCHPGEVPSGQGAPALTHGIS